MTPTDLLQQRTRRYGALTFWSLVIGGYCLGLGALNSLPPAQGVAFHDISVPFTMIDYVKRAGVQIDPKRLFAGGPPLESLEVIINLARLVLIGVILFFGFRRKIRWVVPALLAMQLSLEAGTAIERLGPSASVLPQSVTPAIAEAMTLDAAHRIGQPSCSFTFGTFVESCRPRTLRAMVDYILAQRAYIARDPAETDRHMQAVESYLKEIAPAVNDSNRTLSLDADEVALTTAFQWHMDVMRDWLDAKGFKQPGAAARRLAIERQFAAAALALGSMLALMSATLFVLTIVIRRRIKRINALHAEHSQLGASKRLLRHATPTGVSAP